MVRLTAENRRWWILATTTGGLFRNRDFPADSTVLGQVQFILTGLTVFGAIYVQELLGLGAIAAGLSLLPLLLLVPGAGQLCDSIGPRGPVAAGAALLGTGRLANFASQVCSSASDRGHVPAEVRATSFARKPSARDLQRSKDSLISGISIADCIGGGMALPVAFVAWALLRRLPAADAPATRGLAAAGPAPAAVRNTQAGLPSAEGHQVPSAGEARVPVESQGRPDSRIAPGLRVSRSLWDRQLSSYPPPGQRYFYLGITVAATIVLYYQLYIQYAVSTSVISHYRMTFTYFVYISVVANVIGAFSSLLAGLADRWGRANLVIYGLFSAGLVTAFGLPNAPDKLSYLVLFSALSFVEGTILVATPALVRDFSPQLGRASAMSFWTMGPVIGSIVVTAVVSSTFGGSTTWQDEIRYAGLAGLVMFAVALLALRELAPALRDQIMVTLRDRTLVEARAKGLDTGALLQRQWRQMLRLNVVGPAFGIAVYLLLYYAAVGSFVIYFATVFGYPAQRTNALLNWYWAADAVALLAAGYLSDRLKVRKPFMLIGAIASIAVTGAFAVTARHPHTSYSSFVLILAGIGIAGGVAYAPWMAGFTETVEQHNPAATATGLAVYGWIVRAVVALSAAFLPVVVSSVTPLVEHGATVNAAAVRAAPALNIIEAHPRLFAELARYPAGHAPPALQAQAIAAVGPPGLLTVKAAGPALATLRKYGAVVREASATNPGQWQNWWRICLAGQIIFVPFIFVMTGRWRPQQAARDLAVHEKLVMKELARLQAEARQ